MTCFIGHSTYDLLIGHGSPLIGRGLTFLGVPMSGGGLVHTSALNVSRIPLNAKVKVLNDLSPAINTVDNRVQSWQVGTMGLGCHYGVFPALRPNFYNLNKLGPFRWVGPK